VKGQYDGESLTVEGILLGRGLPFYGEFFGGFSWICREGVEFCSREGLVQGHRFAGGFGHGGQDIHMISWS
jgi:hypothetical protein